MKRVLLGTIAVLTAAVLPFSGAFAKDDALDYANSIGRLDESDTINLVVEATSDGGYVVGGQALSCIKYTGWSINAANLEDGDYEILPTEECEVEEIDVESQPITYGVGGSLEDICNSTNFKLFTVEGDGGDDDNYVKELVCRSYIAKFQKDGTREWLTAIDDEERPMAVGEIANGYRLLVQGGNTYTVSKSGEPLSSMALGDGYVDIDAAKFDEDGSLFIATFPFIHKYDQNGEEIAKIPADDAPGYEEYGVSWTGTPNDLLMNGDIYVNYCTGNNDSFQCGIAKISKDLKTVTPIVINNSEENEESMIVSSDDEGNILVYSNYYDEEVDENGNTYTVQRDPKLTVYDKDGNKLSQIDFEDGLFDGFFGDDMVDAMPGFVLYSYGSNRIIKLGTNLEPIVDFTLDENEKVNNAVIINDGSIILVGDSTSSTDNYEVTGDQNGIQIRLDVRGQDDPQPQPGDGVVNPGTLDGIQMVMMIGGIALLCGGIAGRKLIIRR